ncbi:MAG: SusC/RagA family TonB-linked outer membrane protein [Alistipes sp.]|nr:SusC/RagA family TonB-linked outer membrane protein [Alistipes sp.]
MKRFLLFILCCFAGIAIARAQALQVNGVVKDESGAPVIGATVIVKGTQTGVTTVSDGSFRITAPSVESILEISFIGYETAEVRAASNVQVTLRSTATAIDEVVVTGMTTMDRRLFTGATDRLAAEDIQLAGVPDISRGLEGRSAGVSVQNVSATFGTAPKIRVRGATSILGSSKPLWVVDGVIMEDITDVSTDDLSSGDALTLISSAVAGLNADDIETFQILKDGSATSIYGAKAMAGVIVITTKKGRPGTARINYTGEFSTRLKPTYHDYDIMNSQDQMGVYREMESKGWLNFAETYRSKNSGVYGRMYKLLNTYDPTTGMFGLANTSEAKNAYLREAEMRNTDWFDLLFKNSVSQTHSVSISTGSERSSSYISMSIMNDPGWYEQSTVKRYTANANNSYRILDNLTMTMQTNASYRKQRAPGTIGQTQDLVSGEVERAFDINPFSYAMNTSRAMDADTYYTRNYTDFNIRHELANNYIDLNVITAKFQGELKWNVIQGLDLSVLGALQYQSSSQAHKVNENSNQANAYRAMEDDTIRENNNYLYDDPDVTNALPVSVLEEGGFYNKTEHKMLAYDFRASANWNKTFNGSHIVSLFGAMDVHAVNRSNDWFQGWGTLYEYGEIAFYNYLAFKQLAEGNNDYYTLTNTRIRTAGYVVNGTYSFEGKYVINGTLRYDGSNRLGKNRSARWLPTWNISGSWNAHEEEFFKRQSVMSNLTIRPSYSLTGDAGPGSVSNSTHIIYNYTPWRHSADDRETGLQIEYVGNSDLTYEKKHEFNIGVDMGFIGNRINLSTDVYFRNNFDLIGLVTTQGVSGDIMRYANIADMKSKGVEVTLSTRNIMIPNFTWSTDLTFSWAKNEITNYKTTQRMFNLLTGSMSSYSLEGYPVGALFSIPFAGLDENGLPMFYIEGELVDKDNYSKINFQSTEDLDWLHYDGPTDAPYTGGFNNTFKYKNFSLGVFMTYGFGNKIRMTPVFKSSYSDLDSHSRVFKNRWMIPGDELTTDVPVLASYRQTQDINYLSRAYNAYNYSTARVAKGDFIRLKEVSLTYDLPSAWVSKMKMSNMSLRFSGTNLLLLYADKKLNGQDPEYYQSGGVSSPLAKQFTFTLRFGF